MNTILTKTKTTNKWLKKKIKHYIDAGDRQTAIKFARKYGPQIKEFQTAQEINKIKNTKSKPEKQTEKEKTKGDE